MKLRIARLAIALALCLAAGGFASAAVPELINYQGKVYQPSGAAVPDGAYKIAFSIYDVPTGGTAVWTETYDALQVKGSAFHVLLGSINPIGASIFGTADRYLGVKLANDPELSPRQKIASVPYAMVAETVADGSVTTAKLAPGVAIPTGLISMWSGAADAVPAGWALCDGTNGTPDLRDRFVVGAAGNYAVGATGGYAEVTLTQAQMPRHTHDFTVIKKHATMWTDSFLTCGADSMGEDYRGGTGWITYAGNDLPHENRPPYYALCFIMKVAG